MSKMLVVNGNLCNKCMIHVREIKRQQEQIYQLIQENARMVDALNAEENGDNVWWYVDGEDNFTQSLLDDVTIITDASVMKRLEKDAYISEALKWAMKKRVEFVMTEEDIPQSISIDRDDIELLLEIYSKRLNQ